MHLNEQSCNQYLRAEAGAQPRVPAEPGAASSEVTVSRFVGPGWVEVTHRG